MRIKINDKIYRLKEIESGADSLMELVEEPKYKDGDFVLNKRGDILIFEDKVGDFIYDHAFLKTSGDVYLINRPSMTQIERHATEEEKQKMLDALAKKGKRWNAEKKCIEDIPKRKFKKGDKVRIKHGVSSKTHRNILPVFADEMDDLIGKTMTVDRYTDVDSYVVCNEFDWRFHEDWLEPYVEDIPKRKFKAGDKVKIKDGISSKTHSGVNPGFVDTMDKFIGKELTVKEYSSRGWVVFYEDDRRYGFSEDWLEPYEELKEGDLAIFWDHDKEFAIIRRYYRSNNGVASRRHQDIQGLYWANAIKFESMEQYEKLLKGEI